MGAEDCGCAGKTATPAPEPADAPLPSATAGVVTASEGLASASLAAAAGDPPAPVEPDKPKEPVWPNALGKAPWEWWAKQKRTGALELRRTALHQRWPAGRELTEAEFDTAVKASDAVIR